MVFFTTYDEKYHSIYLLCQRVNQDIISLSRIFEERQARVGGAEFTLGQPGQELKIKHAIDLVCIESHTLYIDLLWLYRLCFEVEMF